MSYSTVRNLGGTLSNTDYTVNPKIPCLITRKEKAMAIKADYCFVFIYSKDCDVCKKISPRFEKFADKYKNVVVFVKEDVDNKLTLSCKFIPMFELWKKGEKQYIFQEPCFKTMERKLKKLISV